MAKEDLKMPVPWTDKSSTSSLSDYGIKYETRVFDGKRVKVDPRTGKPLTKKAEADYKRIRQAELKIIKDKTSAKNRELLQKGLNIASGGYIDHRKEQNEKLQKAIADSKYSNVPVEHYSKRLLKDEGIDPSHWSRKLNNTQDVLTIGEQNRLDLRHTREKEIAAAQAAALRPAIAAEEAKQAWTMESLAKNFGLGNNGLLISGSGANLVTIGNEADLTTGVDQENEEINDIVDENTDTNISEPGSKDNKGVGPQELPDADPLKIPKPGERYTGQDKRFMDSSGQGERIIGGGASYGVGRKEWASMSKAQKRAARNRAAMARKRSLKAGGK